MPVDQEPPKDVRGSLCGRLDSIQVSNGGVPKTSVAGPVEVTDRGLQGDRQRDLRFHGGPERAVCVFSREVIEDLRGQGHPIAPGTTGENLTISGLDWSLVRTGARLSMGGVTIEITGAAHPCRNIAGSFRDGDFSRLSEKAHPGRGRMYARVLIPGTIRPGDVVTCAISA
jgi:MOSC domain-containing protein YiiM